MRPIDAPIRRHGPVRRWLFDSRWGGIRVATLLLIAYWLALFAGTHAPRQIVSTVTHNDKVVHLAAFAGLAFLLAWAIPTRRDDRWMNVRLALLLAVTYGAIDEFTQIPVGRTADVWDWIADCIGATLGLAAYLSLRAFLAGRRDTQPDRLATLPPNR